MKLWNSARSSEPLYRWKANIHLLYTNKADGVEMTTCCVLRYKTSKKNAARDAGYYHFAKHLLQNLDAIKDRIL